MASEDVYRDFIIELYKNPQNFGKIEGADFHAKMHNTACGDVIELFLKVAGGTIEDAKFLGKGCAISQASASLFTGYLKGRKADALEKIRKEDVLALLKIDLSRNPTRMKCALLPLDALRKAIKK
ncbi:iron-sulfur cluster assembly scaffold protein [Candidatus Micrarchaeota archaeon]|nr:iron-sulfur cluster assembly scaffold protein [Candidatus Micrarchaeota archaeon]